MGRTAYRDNKHHSLFSSQLSNKHTGCFVKSVSLIGMYNAPYHFANTVPHCVKR